MKLRWYQQELRDRLYASLQSNQEVMVQLATGGGKSVLFSDIAREFRSRRSRILFVAHRVELLNQGAFNFWRSGISTAETSFIRPKLPFNPACPLQIASIDSIRNQKKLPAIDLLIADEAHHCASKSYKMLFDSYPGVPKIGFSATPVRQDGKGLGDIFQDLVAGPEMKTLIQEGYLSNYEVWDGSNAVELKGVKKQGGDFSVSQLSERMSDAQLVGDLVKTWKTRVYDRVGIRRTVVFSVDRHHSQLIAQGYNEAGIPALVIHGEQGAREREAVLRQFLLGNAPILVNTGIIGEGFDLSTYAQFLGLPDCDIGVVQMARPTCSLALYLQQVGRALRPAEGKEFAIILDHAGNSDRLGEPDEPREWTLQEGVKKKRRAVELKVGEKACPECGLAVGLRVRLCKCGYQWGNYEVDDSVELNLRKTNPIAELHVWLRAGEPQLTAISKFLKLNPNLGDLVKGAKLLGYDQPEWVWSRWREIHPDTDLTPEDYTAAAHILKCNEGWLTLFDRGYNFSVGDAIEWRKDEFSLWQMGHFTGVTSKRVAIVDLNGKEKKVPLSCVRPSKVKQLTLVG